MDLDVAIEIETVEVNASSMQVSVPHKGIMASIMQAKMQTTVKLMQIRMQTKVESVMQIRMQIMVEGED